LLDLAEKGLHALYFVEGSSEGLLEEGVLHFEARSSGCDLASTLGGLKKSTAVCLQLKISLLKKLYLGLVHLVVSVDDGLEFGDNRLSLL